MSGSPSRPFDAGPCDPEPHYDIPEVPEDLTDVDDRELMQLFSQQIAWQNFFSTLVVQAEHAEMQAELKLTEAKAAAMQGTGKLNDKRAERDTDLAVIKANTDFINAKANRKAYQVVTDNRDRCASLLSRELTRRVGRSPLQGRADKWTP